VYPWFIIPPSLGPPDLSCFLAEIDSLLGRYFNSGWRDPKFCMCLNLLFFVCGNK